MLREKALEPYRELVELAKICLRQSRTAALPETAKELRRMAKQYQRDAAELDGGLLPDIGEKE
jgi:hypothetical protein